MFDFGFISNLYKNCVNHTKAAAYLTTAGKGTEYNVDINDC